MHLKAGCDWKKNEGSGNVFVACLQDQLAQQLVTHASTMWCQQQW